MRPALSVVIGIRNWGLDRLDVAIRAHLGSSIHGIEVVISDYGSENHRDVEAIAHRHGCRYIYTVADVWSRSAALNAGIKAASSENILTTDADILFAPQSHEILLKNLALMPDSVQIIQCRDLPEGFGADSLTHFDWDQLFQVSSIRPRWGMGGSATFTKALFARLHGFEERMTVWGGEDNDLVQRARRSGAILNWVEDAEAQIYHIWHLPDSRGTSSAGTKVVEQNKKILNEDRTMVRNLARTYRGSASFVPTVSIVITTRNRPNLLQESVASCLNQTFQDFEILVVDDGSDDELKPMLDDFGDDRIRLLRLDKNRGVGFARNYANRVARGEFIAIHDDDDLMLPQRLEHQLSAVLDDAAGSYGGWIDFDDRTGALVPNPGRTTFDRGSMMFVRTLVHASILIRRQVLEHYRYNENFLANSDYHLLNRIARGGVGLAHCGHYVILRRLHSHNLTGTHSTVQKSTANISKAMARGAISAGLEQRYKKASRARLEADIPPSEVVAAAQHLPPRLRSRKIRVEFSAPLTGQHGEFQALASVLSSCENLNLEFTPGPLGGVKAVTLADSGDGARDQLISMFSTMGSIDRVTEMMLPLAYPDYSTLEAEIAEGDSVERKYISIDTIEGCLPVLQKHCRYCHLSAGGAAGYILGLPPLQPAVQALLQAKLRRFPADHRSQGGV